MTKHNERGIALVLALFLISALSVLGASLMFLAQTETLASMNYRMMSQARYAAEAGVHRTANFLIDATQYTPQPGNVLDPLTNYDRTKSPVVCVAGCPNSDPNNPNHYVILSASSAMQSNYPVASVVTAFSTVGAGVVHTAAGTNQDVSLTYASYATLIAMQSFQSYGGSQSVVQTWEITVDGSLTNSPKATVQVMATIETPKVTANNYAAFATANTCDAIYLHGNVTVDSYDSSVGPPSGAGNSTESTGGDLGSNGNVHVQGSVDVAGNVYTPRTGVGACTAGAVDGLTGTVDGQLVKLPTDVSFPVPTFPITPPTTAVTLSTAQLGSTVASATATCALLGLTFGNATTTPPGNCDLQTSTGASAAAGTVGTQYTNVVVTGSNTPSVPVVMPSVTVNSGITLTLAAANNPTGQTIDINSVNGSGAVETLVNNTGTSDQSVTLRIAGKNPDGTWMTAPFDLSTMTWKQNATAKSYDATSLQIVYGGPAALSMQGGNSQSAATIYAPNASFNMIGTQDFYGSILANTINNNGNTHIHYDRRLQSEFWIAGHPMMGTFSWKKS